MNVFEIPVKQERQTRQRDVDFYVAPPPLESGDRLTRAEFERRYAATPHVKKAELIEGVVYMPSPVKIEHSRKHGQIILWIGAYQIATPGTDFGDNATIHLEADNVLQPDAFLRLETASGGASRISDDDFVEGPPELIAEIAASSASYDLYDKKDVYRRNGVQEYVVWRVYDKALDWFYLEDGDYHRLAPDAAPDGDVRILRSRVFPGLHLAVDALLGSDMATVLATLKQGVESEAHATFVDNNRLTRQGG